MISMNNVQLLGKVTINPRVRTLANGTRIAEMGIGVPENRKKENGEWDSRMHFVDIVLWGDQAELAEKRFQKGDGALIQGMLQFDQWETKEGQKRNKLKVKAQRIQVVPLPEHKSTGDS